MRAQTKVATVITAALALACGAEPKTGEPACQDTAEPPGYYDVTGEHCVSAGAFSADVEECKADLCAPNNMRVVASDPCAGGGLVPAGRNSTSSGPLLRYLYESRELSLSLSFNVADVSQLTAENLASALEYVWVEAFLPQGSAFSFQATLRGIDAWESVAIAEGRLRGRIVAHPFSIWRHVTSDDPNCLADEAKIDQVIFRRATGDIVPFPGSAADSAH